MRRRFVIPAVAIVALLVGSAAAAAVAISRSGAPPSSGPPPAGFIEVSLTLQAEPPVAARTWLFEVLDDTGAVVERLSLVTAGPELTATGRTSALSYGNYSIRQVLNIDDQASCGPGALFAVSAPAGGIATGRLESPVTAVQFVLTVCDAT